MQSVYQILKAQGERHMKLVGAIQTEMPYNENLARDVDTKWGRGGFIHVPKVGTDRSCNKATMFVTLKDTKVDMLNKDAEIEYGWTCVKVAQYDNGRWIRPNAVWSMVLTNEQFQALVVMGAVDPNSDPKKAVNVDFRSARLFPQVDPNEFYGLKLEQMRREAKFDKLDSLRTAARAYFKKGSIAFPELVRRESTGSTFDPNKVTVYAYYTKATVGLPNEEISVGIDETLYRTNIATGNAKKFTYTREQYIALDKARNDAKDAMKENAELVRVMELGLLESFNGSDLVTSDHGPISLVTSQERETYRSTPEEVERWKEVNAHRLAPAPEKKVKEEAPAPVAV